MANPIMGVQIDIKRIPWNFCVKSFVWVSMACIMSVVGSKQQAREDRMAFHGGNLFLIVALQYTISEELPNAPSPG